MHPRILECIATWQVLILISFHGFQRSLNATTLDWLHQTAFTGNSFLFVFILSLTPLRNIEGETGHQCVPSYPGFRLRWSFFPQSPLPGNMSVAAGSSKSCPLPWKWTEIGQLRSWFKMNKRTTLSRQQGLNFIVGVRQGKLGYLWIFFVKIEKYFGHGSLDSSTCQLALLCFARIDWSGKASKMTPGLIHSNLILICC